MKQKQWWLGPLCLMMIFNLAGCGTKPKKIATLAEPSSLALDASGEFLFIACEHDRKVMAWSTRQRRKTAEAEVDAGPLRIYCDPAKSQLVVLCQGGKSMIRLQLPALKKIERLRLPDGPVAWAGLPEKSEQYFCSPETNLIRAYVGKNPLPAIEAGLDPMDLLLQPDSGTLWVANARANEVAMIHLRKGTVAVRAPVWNNPIRLVTNIMGDKLYVLCTGKDAIPAKSMIHLVDFYYQSAGLTWPAGIAARDMTADAMGRNLFVVDEKLLRVISAQTGLEILSRPLGADPQRVVVSPDGLQAYVSCRGDQAVYQYSFKKDQVREK